MILLSLFLFLERDFVSIIFGLLLLGLGIYIILNKKEDEIEPIKSQRKLEK
jgi:LPXTG-motif cell wall-anchored protein